MSRQLKRYLAVMDRPLDNVHRFPAVQRVLHLMAKFDIREIVDQQDRTKQPSEMHSGLIDELSTRRHPKARECLDCSALPTLHGCGNPYQFVPSALNEAQSNIGVGDGNQLARHIMMPGNMQTYVAQVGQSRTEIEAQQP